MLLFHMAMIGTFIVLLRRAMYPTIEYYEYAVREARDISLINQAEQVGRRKMLETLHRPGCN